MFKMRNLKCYAQNELVSNLMPATGFKTVWRHLSAFIVPSKTCKLPIPYAPPYHQRCWLLTWTLITHWKVSLLFSPVDTVSNLDSSDNRSLFHFETVRFKWALAHRTLVARCSPSWIISEFLAFSALCCPRTNFLRPVAGITFEISLFSGCIQLISLNICSIVNKILTHVIWKSLFSFYSILKTSQHFQNSGCSTDTPESTSRLPFSKSWVTSFQTNNRITYFRHELSATGT